MFFSELRVKLVRKRMLGHFAPSTITYENNVFNNIKYKKSQKEWLKKFFSEGKM